MGRLERGARVRIRDAQGVYLTKRALSAVVDGRDFPVVWACREEEWDAARAENREPEGVPWPAQDVRSDV